MRKLPDKRNKKKVALRRWRGVAPSLNKAERVRPYCVLSQVDASTCVIINQVLLNFYRKIGSILDRRNNLVSKSASVKFGFGKVSLYNLLNRPGVVV